MRSRLKRLVHSGRAAARREFANKAIALRHRFVKSRYDLTPYELRVYSQNGEDGVLAELLRRLPPGTRSFVEFGTGDGLETNTRRLAQSGWRGLYIEGDDQSYASLERLHAGNPRVNTVRAHVTPRN